MTPGWTTVSTWERVEPLQHRTPLPEALLHAMVALSFSWGWRFFASILIYSFYSVSRVGEVLRADRDAVLTPRDLLFETDRVYLKIENPKTRNRGARVQYSSAENMFLVKFAAETWDTLLPDQPLYAGSPASFRTRWNAILKHLNIPHSFGLTPGSLRGGGAVAAHRRGVSVPELMWKMRISQQKALSYYLQETAAISNLPKLPERARSTIKLLQGLLPCLCEALNPQRTAVQM